MNNKIKFLEILLADLVAKRDTLEIDLNSCDLEEVILTLFSNGLLTNKDIKVLTGWNFKF